MQNCLTAGLVVVTVSLMLAATAWGAIGIDVSTSESQGSATNSVSTSAFSTSSGNELLLAFVAADSNGSPNTTVTQVTGASLTWVLVKRTNIQTGTAEIWRAFAPSVLNGVTVTATLSQKVASFITVMSFSGVNTSGTNGSGAIGSVGSGNANPGPPTAKLITQGNGSFVVGVGNDWDKAIARTPGTGQNLVGQYLAPFGDTYWVQMQSSPIPLSGTAVTINDTAPTGDRYNLSIAEILAAAGSGTTGSISGTISPAVSGNGATVTLSQNGTTVATTTVPASGTTYSFSNVASGAYTVTPTQSGVTFSPTSQTVTVNNGNATVPVFTASLVSDLTILKTHSGSFTQGQTGASYTITPTNSGGAATSGIVTVTDTLPTGLTATAMSGTNWACTLSTLTCTRNDALAAGASYPTITLTVNVASNAPASVTNTATVSGGGETNTSNDTANDPTTITPYGALVHVGGGSAHPVVANQVMTFNYTPVGTNNALVILIGCRSPGVTSMSLTAPGWTFTPISGLVGPSSYSDFISTFGAITPNTTPVTFTVTLTGGNGNCSSNDTTVLADEFSGNDPRGGTTTFDAHSESFDNGVIGICTGAPVTPANNNDAVWYGCFDNVSGVSGGYTKGQDDATGDWTEYKTLSGGVNVVQNPGFVTNPSFLSFGLGAVSIKPAGGGTLFTVTGTASPTSLVSGGSVVLSQNGATVASTTIGSNGSYTFSSVANGTYRVTPTQSGVIFSPTSQLVTVSGANATVPVFTGTMTSVGIQLLQKNVNGNEATSSKISAAFPSNNTPGNFLIVTGTAARPASTISITDSAGNTYIPAMGPVTDSNQDVTAYIWYVPNCKGGANTVTLTPSTADALEIHISEWTGLATSFPVDQTASATGTGTTASSGSKTTALSGELIFGYTFLFNTASAGGGFTGMSLVNGDLDEYQVLSLAGPIAATFTQTSGTWFALMATFSSASGGTGSSWSISGTISGAGGNGATVTLSSGTTTIATTTASGAGAYSFNNVNNGNFTVTPTNSGFTFTPLSQNVTVNNANLTGVDFTSAVSASGGVATDAIVLIDKSTSSTTIVSPMFSTKSSNELLLAFIATDAPSSGTNTTVSSMTGAGLTWALVERTNVQRGTSEIWRTFASAPLTNVSVSATFSSSQIASMTVVTFTGVDTSGVNGSGAVGPPGTGNAGSGAPTASLVTTRNASWVFGVGNDWDKAIGRTPGANQSLVHQFLSPAGDTYWVQKQSAKTATKGTTVTIDDTAPSGDRYNLSIVEVLPSLSGGGGSGTPPTVSITSPPPNSTVANVTTVAPNVANPGYTITGVQFLLDENNLGALVTSPPYSITWDTTMATSGLHTLSATAFNSVGLSTTSSPVATTVDNSGNPAVVGSWSSPVSIPTVAVNLILLKNNTLLFYEDGASPTVWDYVSNVFTSVPAPVDLFCSGHAALADGRILVVGGFGQSGNNMGISDAEIFDPTTNTWTSVAKMAYQRWHPTATTLSDGRVLVTGGWKTTAHTNAGIPEIYDPVANKWTSLTNANNPFETYPFIYMLSDGRLVHVNGSEYATVTDILDPATQSWSVVDSNITAGGSAAMYLPDKIMKAGSASDSQFSGPSSNTTYVIDMTQASPSWKQSPSMVYPRSFFNLTTLPDGTVLATGGETDKNGGNISNAVYPAELWSPQSQTWMTMASMHTPGTLRY